MTSINRPAVYIPVPIPILEDQVQPTSAPEGASPLPYGAYRKSTAQRLASRSEQPPSLGSSSINDTPSIKPGQIAWDSLKKCPVEVKAKYGKLLYNFCNYMDMCDNSGFAAEGIAVGSPCKRYPPYALETGTGKNDYGKRRISGPLLNRWHPDRRKAWIARMHELATWYDANRIEGCTLITLTGYQETSGLSWYDTLDKIQESRTKLLKILRKYIGKISYFWVVEPHTQNDTGYPHIHLAVFTYVDNSIRDGNGEGMEDKLRRLYSEEWKTGSHTYGLDFQPMKGDNSIKDLKNYLMKYISKGYITSAGWSTGELIFNAHLYGATHGNRPPQPGEQCNIKGEYTKKYRIIGMSRDLSKLLKPEPEDKEDIVWLTVDETEPTEIREEDGTITTEERRKTIYSRQLIPDWLDWCTGATDWGRPISKMQSWHSRAIDERRSRGIPDKPQPVPGQLSPRQLRKMREEGYL